MQQNINMLNIAYTYKILSFKIIRSKNFKRDNKIVSITLYTHLLVDKSSVPLLKPSIFTLVKPAPANS